MSVQVSGLPSYDQSKRQKFKTHLLVTPQNGYFLKNRNNEVREV